MPTRLEYITGYGLRTGETFGKFELALTKVEVKSIVKFNEYSYVTTLVFHPQEDTIVTEVEVSVLLNNLNDRFAGERVIRSRSNRPFKYVFQDSLKGELTYEIDNNVSAVTVHSVGHCKRIKEADARNYTIVDVQL